MAKVQSSFTSDVNGFRFANFFKLNFPIKFPLPFVGTLDLKDVVFGLCGGMCAAALDYYYSEEPVPDDDRPDLIDQRLFTYLCERQLQSLSIPILLKIIEWMMAEDADLVSRMTRWEIPKLRRSLDDGKPVILCLIRAKGLSNPTANHQVVATGYEISPDGKTMSLFLYEPNHPGFFPSINVGLSKAGFKIGQSTSEPLRGLFVLPYTRQTTFPRPLAPEPISFDVPDGFSLQWPVDSRICTQRFNEHPEWYNGFGLPGHEGLDLLALDNASIRACADGDVFEAGPRSGHPYGTQVRIRHQWGDQEYHTIYAHLNRVTVQVGQTVSAGQEIGKADSTGNSTGSHLHLTLKKIGTRTGGYPADIVDPWPYLLGSIAPVHEPPVSPSGVTVYTNNQVNLRAQPSTDADVFTSLPVDEGLAVLGSAESERPKIGQDGQWLKVRTASSQEGYVAAWLVSETRQDAFPPSGIIVYPSIQANLRSGPGTAFDVLGTFVAADPLMVLGDADTTRARVGQENQWLQVQAQNGLRGFMAAWLVHITGEAPPSSGLFVYPSTTVNVRARPAADANVLCTATPGDKLDILGDRSLVMPLIGQQEQWINVRTPNRLTGYVAAWLVQTARPPASSISGLSVATVDFVNIRAQTSTNSPVLSIAEPGERLEVIDVDLIAAQGKAGQQDQWLYVRRNDGTRGWVAAWYVKLI